MKKWYESKTILANIATFLVGVAAIADQLPIGPQGKSYLIAAAALANIALRVFTSEPIQGVQK